MMRHYAFTGDPAGNVLGLRTADGKTFWHAAIGCVGNSLITYELDGRQFVLVGGETVAVCVRAARDRLGSLTTVRQRCTRPEASPFASASTSATDTRLKSPGIVCFSALAATAKRSAASSGRPVTIA